MNQGVFKLKKAMLLCAILMSVNVYISSSPNAGKVVFYPICREFQKKNFIWNNIDFLSIENSGFKIYYKYSSYDYVEAASDSAQKNLEYIVKDFNYQPKEKINIVLYSEYTEMAKNIGLNNGSTAAGAYYRGVINILDSCFNKNGILTLNKDISKDSLMLHELTHYTLDYMTGGNIPVWFTEGIALYEEYNVYGFEWARTKTYIDYYNPQSMEEDFYQLDEVKAYKQSFLIVSYIVKNHGMESLIAILNELSEGKSMNQTLITVLNMDMYELFCNSLGRDNLRIY